MTDTKRLNELIKDSGLSKIFIAKGIGLKSVEGLNNKLNGDSEFKQSEIVALQKILHLSVAERNAIFFAK